MYTNESLIVFLYPRIVVSFYPFILVSLYSYFYVYQVILLRMGRMYMLWLVSMNPCIYVYLVILLRMRRMYMVWLGYILGLLLAPDDPTPSVLALPILILITRGVVCLVCLRHVLFMNPGCQCLGSGSVGSARLWLPGSGSAKLCGSTDLDPRGKILTKNCNKKKNLISKPKSELLKKERI